jgi:DNA polymerase elongation subunit (family B)
MGFKRLFFDIETSYCQGWFWQPSFKTSITYEQVIKHSAIICICYKWEGSNKVHSLQWDKGNDKEMCLKFAKILEDADEVVGHNGDRFDIPKFRTRLLLHGVKSMADIKSIDTLKISRSKFKFKSNRLDNIGKELGFGGKKDTGGIQLWHDIIQRNSKKAMSDMIAYCKRDVELLEKVFVKLEGFAAHKTHVGVFMGKGKCSCPYCGEKDSRVKDRRISAAGMVKVILQCNVCLKYYNVPIKVYNDSQKKTPANIAKIY